MSALRLVGCGFGSRWGHPKDSKNGPHCLSAWHSVFGVSTGFDMKLGCKVAFRRLDTLFSRDLWSFWLINYPRVWRDSHTLGYFKRKQLRLYVCMSVRPWSPACRPARVHFGPFGVSSPGWCAAPSVSLMRGTEVAPQRLFLAVTSLQRGRWLAPSGREIQRLSGSLGQCPYL